MRKRSRALVLGATLAMVATQASVAFAQARPETVAQTFLGYLDSGQIQVAYQGLDPLARQTYSYPQFVQSVASRKGQNVSRQMTFVGRPNRTWVNVSQSFRSNSQSNYFLVCFREVPASGWGKLTYVEVVLTDNGARDPQIANFTFQSEPDQQCPK